MVVLKPLLENPLITALARLYLRNDSQPHVMDVSCYVLSVTFLQLGSATFLLLSYARPQGTLCSTLPFLHAYAYAYSSFTK